jgi:hypothetical protein
VHVSNAPKRVSLMTGKEEWNYVDAHCEVCGRVAGRSACLVKIERG